MEIIQSSYCKKKIKLNLLFKLSNLNSNFALTHQALNNSALFFSSLFENFQ